MDDFDSGRVSRLRTRKDYSVDSSNKNVFQVINNALNRTLRDVFGPPVPGDNLSAKVAVALLQLSLRYFAATGAPKAVVFDFFSNLMNGGEAGYEKNEAGILVPKKEPLG